MRRLHFVILLGVFLLVMGFGGALAQMDTSDWYWDAELGLYISWDDAYGVYYLYNPTEEMIWAYETSSSLYYVYDPYDEQFYEVGYVDAGGGVVETEGSYGTGYTYEEEMDPLTYEMTVNMMQMNHEMIMNGIATMTGSGYYYDYGGGYGYGGGYYY